MADVMPSSVEATEMFHNSYKKSYRQRTQDWWGLDDEQNAGRPEEEVVEEPQLPGTAVPLDSAPGGEWWQSNPVTALATEPSGEEPPLARSRSSRSNASSQGHRSTSSKQRRGARGSGRSSARAKQYDANKWISADLANGYIRVYHPDNFFVSQLIPCTEETTAHKVCLQLGIPSTGLHLQQGGDQLRRLEPHETPLGLQCSYLRNLGYSEPRRIQKVGTSTDLAYLVRFYSGRPFQDGSTYQRNNVQGVLEVRKGRIMVKWVKRLCVISGSRFLVYKGCDKNSRPTVLYLGRGRVTGVAFKLREFCLKVVASESGAGGTNGKEAEKTVYICLKNEAEYQKWHRQLTKATNKLPANADLSHCHLETIPEPVFANRELQNLNLRHNNLQRRPPGGDGHIRVGWIDDISKFKQLSVLNLADNDLQEFPLSLCEIDTLVELNLSSNKLSKLPNKICKLHRLEALHVHNNHLSTLPWEVSCLTRLGVLVLAFNWFETVPEAVCHMADFNESLIMAGNGIEHLPENVAAQLKSVKRIDLRLNNLKLKACEALHLSQFEKLTHLDVRDNLIVELDLRSLSCLEFVSCERNKLERLQLNGSGLRTVLAAHNELQQLEIAPKPEWLETIDVSFNKLKLLPDNLSQCYFLEKLYAAHNDITELPESLFAEPGTRLKILRLGHNSLSGIPTQVVMVALEELQLQNNWITSLSENFLREANKLRILNLSKNRLVTLPPLNENNDRNRVQELYLSFNLLEDPVMNVIRNYERLKVLHIAHNRIRTLDSQSMAFLELLRELNISGNRLKHLPSSLVTLPNLNILRAHSNALRRLPELPIGSSLRVLDLGCNRLLTTSVKNLMDSRLSLLDVSCNDRLNMSVQDLSELQTRKKICLVDMTGEGRDNGIYTASTASGGTTSSLPRAPISPRKLHNIPFMAGLGETSGNRNKLCVSVVKKVPWPTPDSAVFAMFDGGYNNAVPRLLQEHFPRALLEELRTSRDEAQVLKYTLLTCHKKLRATGQRLGASAAVVYLKRQSSATAEEKWQLTVANVGDVQVYLTQSGDTAKPMKLTRLFKVTDDQVEAKRIGQADGLITEDCKVNGTTVCTRLLGCSYLYPQVIPEPQVTQTSLTSEDDCLVIATKTLWNYVTPEEAMHEARSARHPVVAAKRLMDLAQAYGSAENVSVLVLKCRLGQPVTWWDLEPIGGDFGQEIVSDDDTEEEEEAAIVPMPPHHNHNLSSSIQSIQSADSWQPTRIDRAAGYNMMAARSALESAGSASGKGSESPERNRKFLKKHEVSQLEARMRSRISGEIKSREVDSALNSASAAMSTPQDTENKANWAAAQPKYGRKMNQYLGNTHRSLLADLRSGGHDITSEEEEEDILEDRLGDASLDPPSCRSSQISVDPTYTRIDQYPKKKPTHVTISVPTTNSGFTTPVAVASPAAFPVTTPEAVTTSTRVATPIAAPAAAPAIRPAAVAAEPEPVPIEEEPIYAVVRKKHSPFKFETQECGTDLESELSGSMMSKRHINEATEDTPL